MSGTEAARSTWRADRYSPCPRPDAARYLAFLASIGHHVSVIEQAVADGVPYAGDIPVEPILGEDDADAASRADNDASAKQGRWCRRRSAPERRR